MARFEDLSTARLTIPPAPAGTGSSVATLSLTPASVGAATVAAQSFTVPGVALGDTVMVVGTPITNAVGALDAAVTAADTVAVRFVNPTVGALTPTAGVYRLLILKAS